MTGLNAGPLSYTENVPSGIVHARASIALSVPSFALAFGATNNWLPAGLAAASGCLLGILMSPDLDQESLSTAEYKLIKYTLGLGFLWTMVWFPYALCLKHRSPLSHWPLLGTAGRLAYVGIFVLIALHFGWKPPQISWALLAWGVVGLAISDAAHWYMDFHWPGRKRRD